MPVDPPAGGGRRAASRTPGGTMSDPTPTLTTGLFKGLSDADADQILGAGERGSYPAGTAIFNQGDQGDAMFVISSGEARVDVGGRFHILKPGDFFGEMALLA